MITSLTNRITRTLVKAFVPATLGLVLMTTSFAQAAKTKAPAVRVTQRPRLRRTSRLMTAPDRAAATAHQAIRTASHLKTLESVSRSRSMLRLTTVPDWAAATAHQPMRASSHSMYQLMMVPD